MSNARPLTFNSCDVIKRCITSTLISGHHVISNTCNTTFYQNQVSCFFAQKNFFLAQNNFASKYEAILLKYTQIYRRYLHNSLRARALPAKLEACEQIWITNHLLFRANVVSFRECTQMCTVLRCFYYSRTIARAEPSLREMSLSPFTERFATGLRFVTSNWRRRHSECTCGTMNSDPPTTATTTTIARREGAEERTRSKGAEVVRRALVVETRERERKREKERVA